MSRARDGRARGHAARALLTAAGLGLTAAAGCSSSSKHAASVSTTAAATTTSSAPASTVRTLAATGLRGKRYCELLLATIANGRVTANVYNTYPLNACPPAAWKALDAAALAKADKVDLVLRNGPRYWLMDRIDKVDSAARRTREFGGIAMIWEATVKVGAIADATRPYVEHRVDRATVFSFDAGHTVYELLAPGGTTYVMQSWSQQVDPTLGQAGLADLGARLKLPAGWRFRARRLAAPLRVVTTATDARVIRDDLQNTYSREPAH